MMRDSRDSDKSFSAEDHLGSKPCWKWGESLARYCAPNGQQYAMFSQASEAGNPRSGFILVCVCVRVRACVRACHEVRRLRF